MCGNARRGRGSAQCLGGGPASEDEREGRSRSAPALHELARRAGLVVPEATTRRFGSDHHTYLSRRFDRTPQGGRLHFASAMTLLDRRDGEAADEGVSYLELAELLLRLGANTTADLEQLWRRMVFFVCVSNTDDHLRNHGFMATSKGYRLAPAYDVNPDPHGEGLKLNISETGNAQDLGLLREVAPFFRVKSRRVEEIIDTIVEVVANWRQVALRNGLPAAAQDRVRRAFRVAENSTSKR